MEKQKRKEEENQEITTIIYSRRSTRCLEIFEPVKYDEIIEITPEIYVRFNDAGHMLGFKYY